MAGLGGASPGLAWQGTAELNLWPILNHSGSGWVRPGRARRGQARADGGLSLVGIF